MIIKTADLEISIEQFNLIKETKVDDITIFSSRIIMHIH